MRRRLRSRCAVQVDMDGFDVMLRYHGHTGGAPASDFYELVMPRLLDLFERQGVAATFFVIGDDARGRAGAWLPRIVAAGHEVASHTASHPFGITKLGPRDREREIVDAEESIGSRTGAKPVGFRSPGYDIDAPLVELLEQRGYLYDSSVFPSSLQLGIRLMQRLIRLRRDARHGTMGGVGIIAAPRIPYRPALGSLSRVDPSRAIVELPIATLPLLRLPFHGTAVLAWGSTYVDLGLATIGDGDIVFAMHGVDVADASEIDRRLLGQPGLRLPLSRKLATIRRILASLGERRVFVRSQDLATAA